MIALAAAGVLLALMALALPRLVNGPTLYDRALAAHAIVFIAALAGAALAIGAGAPRWIDVAIVLVFADLAVAVCVLKVFRHRSLQPPVGRASAIEEGGA